MRKLAILPVAGPHIRPIGIKAMHSEIFEQACNFRRPRIASHAVAVDRGDQVRTSYRIIIWMRISAEISAFLFDDLRNAVSGVEAFIHSFFELLKHDALQQLAFQVVGFRVSHARTILSPRSGIPESARQVNRGLPLMQGALG